MTNKTFYLNSAFEAKSYRKGSKSLKIAGYANTITKDRAGDVVTAEAWAKGVENFRKNPVMLYQHKHDTPIGRIEKIVVDTKGIYVEGAVSEAAEKIHGIQTETRLRPMEPICTKCLKIIITMNLCIIIIVKRLNISIFRSL